MGMSHRKADPAEYRVPRNFKLLEELENAEKGKYSDTNKYGDDCNWITLGLDGDDATFTNWNATIIPYQRSHIGARIYYLKVKAGEKYPDEPPEVKFIQKVKMNVVTSKGLIDFTKLSKSTSRFVWNREKCVFEVLLAIRKEMQPNAVAKACSEVPEGTKY